MNTRPLRLAEPTCTPEEFLIAPEWLDEDTSYDFKRIAKKQYSSQTNREGKATDFYNVETLLSLVETSRNKLKELPLNSFSSSSLNRICVRFVLTTSKTNENEEILVFGEEDAAGSRSDFTGNIIPGHGEIAAKNGNKQCIAAGVIGFNENNEICFLSNKSGDFKCNYNTLPFLLYHILENSNFRLANTIVREKFTDEHCDGPEETIARETLIANLNKIKHAKPLMLSTPANFISPPTPCKKPRVASTTSCRMMPPPTPRKENPLKRKTLASTNPADEINFKKSHFSFFNPFTPQMLTENKITHVVPPALPRSP